MKAKVKRGAPDFILEAVKPPEIRGTDGNKFGVFVGVRGNGNILRHRTTKDIVHRCHEGYVPTLGDNYGLNRKTDIVVLAYTRPMKGSTSDPKEEEVFALDIIESRMYRGNMNIEGHRKDDALVVIYHEDGCREVPHRPSAYTPEKVVKVMALLPTKFTVGSNIKGTDLVVKEVKDSEVVLVPSRSGTGRSSLL